jgi:hypothetical protein
MRIIKNEYKIIKADGSEVIDVTNEVVNSSLNKGSVLELGNGYTDNPVATMSLTLKNTNDKLYSPHFKANKVKYAFEYELTGAGTDIYGSPFKNTIKVVSFDDEYTANWIKGQIMFNKPVPAGVVVKIGITYIDTTELNPLNHLPLDIYSPLISEGNICYRNQYTIDTENTLLKLKGNGTNFIPFEFGGVVRNYKVLTVVKHTGGKSLEYIYNLSLEDFYSKSLKELFGDFDTSPVAYVDRYEIYDDVLFTMSLEDIYAMSLEDIYSTKLEDLEHRIYFNRVIEEDEYIFIAVQKESIVEQNLKFYGKITNAVNSDIETCSLECKDLSYDLQNVGLEQADFRRYFSNRDETEKIYTLEEKLRFVNVVNNSIVTTYNDLPVSAVGDTFELYDGQDYFECIVTVFNSSKNIEFSSTKTVENGEYSVYIRKYEFSLENFIQNCLDDATLNYNLFVKNFSEFQVIPKEADLQYGNLWSVLQSMVTKIGMFLGFEYTKSTDTYYNYDGTSKQGTDSYELVIKNLTIEPALTGKYSINEKDVEKQTTFSANGLQVVNSYTIKYYSAETDQYETEIVDDTIKSVHSAIVVSEKNVIVTDELLNLGDMIRIGLEYRKVTQVIDSQTYRVNLPFTNAGTFDLYIPTGSILKYGLKRASITQDNTSEIDTKEEAIRFGAICLSQSLDSYATYKMTVLTKHYPNIQNFDTLKIHMPRFNLLNKNMVVQSVEETNDRTTFTLNEILRVGKWKYYNMRTETGSNKITTSEDIGTNDKFPPVTNLTAQEPAIDNAGGYQVFTRVSWNNLVGRNVVSYELQYKKESEDWETAEKMMIKSNSTKVILKEQSVYNIRVKATGKEQLDGEWAETSVDSSKYFVVNPIENRTWYIRLFEGNDIDEYFTQFDKLGYTVSELDEAIDSIEIVPNSVFFGERSILWEERLIDTSRVGLQQEILDRTITLKNLYIRPILNGFYKLKGLFTGESSGVSYLTSALSLDKFKNIDGFSYDTIFKGYNNIYCAVYANPIDNTLKVVKNIKFLLERANYDSSYESFGVTGVYGTSSVPLNKSKIILENIFVEHSGFDGNWFNIGFFYCSKIRNCWSKGAKFGFWDCTDLVGNLAEDSIDNGFHACYLMSRNTTKNCVDKYRSCFASLSVDPTYLIPTNGGDNPNAGFNT